MHMPDPHNDPFGARTTVSTPLGDRTVYRLDALGAKVDALPYCIKVLLEACLRNCDGRVVTEDAVRAVLKFRRIEPDEAIGFHNLGVLAEKQGGTRRAVAAYRQALGLDPTLVPAAKHLAWILATSSDAGLRDGKEAVRRLERCMKAPGRRPADVLATLAAAHAETGDFDAAVGWQTKALRAAPENRVADYRSALRRYGDHQPYRQDPRRQADAPWAPRYRILISDR